MSPTIATIRPSTEPNSSIKVETSSIACVGCSWRPSPALMTGHFTPSATIFAPPDTAQRTTIAATPMHSMLRAVSTSDSPLLMLDPLGVRLKTCPPRRCTAVSKLQRVRVESSKNKFAITRPLSDVRLGERPSAIGTFFCVAAISRSNSWRGIPAIVRKSDMMY